MHDRLQRVFVKLLNEGTDVWRPVPGIPLGEDVYQLVQPVWYSPEDEEWEFLPGSNVVCEIRRLSEGPVLVATRLVEGP